ncbi:MAG: hypothetical protein Q7I97_07820 [Thermovirgaceae bacterium]|nr:hypothetical protein [Thermovirgaceae bacterium]
MKRVSVILVALLVALFVVLRGVALAEEGLWVDRQGVESPTQTNIAGPISAIQPGGTAGQVLTKVTDSDYFTEWTTLPNWSPQISGLDSRISDLEETQYVFGLNLRLYDLRRASWNVFANYSANRSKLDRVEIDLTLKLGKSYEEKQIEELRAEIAELKAMLQN